MAEEKVEVSLEGLSRLQSAARDFARAEIAGIAQVVIEELRSRPAVGVFEETNARHFWDEYCWAHQEGPFDDPMILDNTNLGSLADGFDDLLHGLILAEIEKLPKHGQILLSALAYEEDFDIDEDEYLGSIWLDGITKCVAEAVNERAAQRKLDLIGPDRADLIGYEIEGTGFVWSMLDRDVALEVVSGYVDTLIDPNADLSPLAAELVEAFVMAVKEDEGGTVFVAALEHFEDKLLSMIMNVDVLPSLNEMRRKLLKVVDG